MPEGIRTVRKGVVAGVDAETAVLYQFPNRMPFFVMLGYRMGYLMPTKGKPDPGEPREELSGVVFGGGMRVVR